MAKISESKKRKLITAMAAAGYYYDEMESYENALHFYGEYSNSWWNGWQEVEEWLEGVVFDDPATSDAVEKILHPERFGGKKK